MVEIHDLKIWPSQDLGRSGSWGQRFWPWSIPLFDHRSTGSQVVASTIPSQDPKALWTGIVEQTITHWVVHDRPRNGSPKVVIFGDKVVQNRWFWDPLVMVYSRYHEIVKNMKCKSARFRSRRLHVLSHFLHVYHILSTYEKPLKKGDFTMSKMDPFGVPILTPFSGSFHGGTPISDTGVVHPVIHSVAPLDGTTHSWCEYLLGSWWWLDFGPSRMIKNHDQKTPFFGFSRFCSFLMKPEKHVLRFFVYHQFQKCSKVRHSSSTFLHVFAHFLHTFFTPFASIWGYPFSTYFGPFFEGSQNSPFHG